MLRRLRSEWLTRLVRLLLWQRSLSCHVWGSCQPQLSVGALFLYTTIFGVGMLGSGYGFGMVGICEVYLEV